MTYGLLPQPPSPEDYSGEVRQYKIFLGSDQKQEVTCRAALSQCSVQIPAEVQALSISAVTSYGTSPPADVPLRHSGAQIFDTEDKTYQNIFKLSRKKKV